ncbi:OmpA family protein [Flavobacterium sp. 9AF]|uniref:OmpA family protein n=1 Tax=Flavobacterium sp. 9AF TaxID=2653142 RepID=UPI0012F282CF|nr:OmpA family protein [Flavobacterium sp. 9AF]VXB34548.1 OmpA family protein [Flavobacterium sp. 9AF]
MKKTIVLVCLLNGLFSIGQETVGGKVAQKTKDKVYDRTEQRGDDAVDKTLNKIEEGIGSIFKKKDKKKKKGKNESDNETSNTNYDPPVTKTDEAGNTDYSAYKDFDFVPAEKIIFFEDFADGSKSRWKAYDNERLNVRNLEGKNWLELNDGGTFFPIALKTLPKDFTLEFDVYTPNKETGTLSVRFIEKAQAGRLEDPNFDISSGVDLSPVSQIPKTGLAQYSVKSDGVVVKSKEGINFYTWQPELDNFYARISLKRIDNKLSVWVNKEKIMDNEEFFLSNKEYYLTFQHDIYFVDAFKINFSNIRLATGNANPKSDITTKKKFVTQNIYFDVNSDVIRPNSYTILKQIAESIQSLTGNIKIVGHTDSDGKDTDNLILSQKRAESVKRALVNEFGIDTNRLTTDGKGESVPLNKNANASEKAQNRRVEFVRQ